MNRTGLSFKDLVTLVDESVKSGKIESDYPDFVVGFTSLGLSSYVLNLLITHSKDNQDKDNSGELVDDTFFVSRQPEPKTQQEQTSNTPSKKPKGSKLGRRLLNIFIVVVILALGAGCIYLSISNKDRIRYYRELYDDAMTKYDNKCDKLNKIASMTEHYSRHQESFEDWTSTNHSNSSVSDHYYNFEAKAEDRLSFNYFVSSEYDCDFLTVYLIQEGRRDTLLHKSGQVNNSFVYVFQRSGSCSLRVQYNKDISINEHDDKAGISQVVLKPNDYEILLDDIRKISLSD